MHVDIRIVDEESWFPSLIYFTGSKNFNLRMRAKAKYMGFKLNEYGLFDKSGKRMKIRDEKDIFDILGMKYLEPEDRR